MKFRIIQEVFGTAELRLKDGGISETQWIIERKTFWGWKEVLAKELVSERISHKSYADAEAYMISNYMSGNGRFKKNANVYTYEKYVFCHY
jgi:hypothetical protein